ncbi:PspC domain-containing protein [Peptococcus simiae]|uniref:PspC domain-containing protein n=1 Tax=Peptococcus simiae TaxID=1643805 RepID=UPI003980952E
MAYEVNASSRKKRLTRARKGAEIDGVCQGLANYFGWDVSLVRLCFFLPAILPGITMLSSLGLYILLALILPKEAKEVDF